MLFLMQIKTLGYSPHMDALQWRWNVTQKEWSDNVKSEA